ncbi:hypothetical protein [Streptomyces griseus]|uniref:hypothetical protein n=1 Tax=Streptomyces griseus TaxID=1911 RepID=UPI00056737A9|nr:hypothetical protein [Streptomyces griseus]
MAHTVYDVTTFKGSVSPYKDVGKVINEIIAGIKSKQTTQSTRPGVTANQFSFSVPAGNITPSGADPTLVLVAGGDRNYLATNNIKANLDVKIVLDSSTTKTKLLYTGTSDQLQAYTNDYALVATP